MTDEELDLVAAGVINTGALYLALFGHPLWIIPFVAIYYGFWQSVSQYKWAKEYYPNPLAWLGDMNG